ncbi:MAG: hypothetical protein HUJ93_02415 [Bacteroidales bacterium]|nr:hypothetical protein [Bacteroidales bacterium]
MTKTLNPTFTTLKDLYDHSICTYGDKVAFSMVNGNSFTYAEISITLDEMREMLTSAGVGIGCQRGLWRRICQNFFTEHQEI